jgi:4-amino-4-deoxy-L-arabinose transferase-like glycosyltransferase
VRGTPLPLKLLLLVAAIEVLAWTAVTTPFQGPDEAAHYAYVQYLAETGHKPSFDGGGAIFSHETDGLFTGFNLYALKRNAAVRPMWTSDEVSYWKQFQAALTPAARKNGSGPNSVAKNPPLYYGYESIPYRAALALGAEPFTRLFWMRLANAVFFLLTIVLTWLSASELFQSVLARTVATAAVALQPMAAFMAGVVNPDSLLMALWAGALLVALRLLIYGFTAPRVIGLLGLSALALVTHGRGLPLLPFALVAIGLGWWRHRPKPRRAAVWLGAGLATLVALFVAYRVFLNGNGGGGLYGGELRFARHFSPTEFASFVWQFYLPKLPFMTARPGPAFGFQQFFIQGYLPGAFGGEEVRFSDNVYRLVQLAVVAGLVWLVVALVSVRQALRARWDEFALLVALLVFTLGFLHLASFRAVLDPGARDALIVGRYLLPLTPLFGLALALLVQSLRERWRGYAAAAFVATGVALQLGGLGLSIGRFYG